MKKKAVSIITALSVASAAIAVAHAQTDQPTLQGWNKGQEKFWYYTTQGSRLIPLSWLKALEQAGSTELLMAPASVRKYGLLVDSDGVEGLPVGFAVDDQDDRSLAVTNLRWYAGQGARERWAGLTCAACHTGEVDFEGRRLRIPGGPSLFDYQSFIEALDSSLAATAADPAKFSRFAAVVLKGRNSAGNRAMLKQELGKLLRWERLVDEFNETPLRYGLGRVDAFGHIYNKVTLFAGNRQPLGNAADAPVSYPFLWDIYRHDKLQWNGIVERARLPLGDDKFLDYGALGRNTGEVLGVFGDVVVKRASAFPPVAPISGYRSSVNVQNLDDLETQLRSLKPPAWPGRIDTTLRDKGRLVFVQHCQSCHQPQPGTGTYEVTMVRQRAGSPNATDPWMACNAISYDAPTVRLKGTPKSYIGLTQRFGDRAPVADMLETTVKGTLVGKKGAIIRQAGRIVMRERQAPAVALTSGGSREARLARCYASNSEFMAYKARPLDGIWATAPYLHNGSVPTLADLLEARAKRPSTFYVGTRVYDKDRVGYKTTADAPGNSFLFRARDARDEGLPGNSNDGHDYGAAGMTPDDRRNLLEYLKSL